jgi:hypothetical protein
MKRVLIACAALAAAALAACSTIPRFEAANDIHDFLVAIRDGDRAAFDAHVDRPALKTNLRARVLEIASGSHSSASTAAALFAGPLVDVAVEAGVRPEVFRLAAAQYGYDPAKPLPSTLAIAQLVRPLDGGRACIVTRAKGPCVFLFKDEGGVWKLIDFQGHIALDKGRLKLTE